MAGEVIECPKCRAQTRWGFPSRAIEFALSKRPGATTEQIIDEFFGFNSAILRNKPADCPHCKAKSPAWVTVHEYA